MKKVYIVERVLYSEYSVWIAVFDSFEKAKKEYNELLEIRKEDFKDQWLTVWNTYTSYDYGYLQISEMPVL